MDQFSEHDVARIISAYFDDHISEFEFSQLTQWLSDNEGHAREFVRAAMVHNGMRAILQNADLHAFLVAQDLDSDLNFRADSESICCMPKEGEVTEVESEQPLTGLRVKGRPSRRMLFLAIAASLLLSFFGVRSLVNRQADQQPADARQGAVFAVCRVADSLKWSGVGQSIEPGDAVRTGRFALESGELQIETFDGAVLTLQGPCDVSFESADKVVCHRGRLLANVLRDDAHLVVATPAGEVLHYGTVYSVNVVDSGATELSVFDGSVGLSSVTEDGTPESSHVVLGGDAIRVEASGKVVSIGGKSQQPPDQLGFHTDGSDKPFRPRPIVVGPAGFDVTHVKSKKQNITCLREADLLLAGKIDSSEEYRASDVPWIDYQYQDRYMHDYLQSKYGNPYLDLFKKNDPFPGCGSVVLGKHYNSFAIRATAQLVVPDTWLYSFAVVADDGARLRIDGQDVVVDDGTHSPLLSIVTLPLQAGVHAIELVAYNVGGICAVELGVAPGKVRDMHEFRLLTK